MPVNPKPKNRSQENPALRSSSLDDMPRFVRPMMGFILLASVYLGSLIVLLLAGVGVVMVTMSLLSGGSGSEAAPAIAWLVP